MVIPNRWTVFQIKKVISNQGAVIRNKGTVIRNQGTVIPNQGTSIPKRETVIPKRETVIPTFQIKKRSLKMRNSFGIIVPRFQMPDRTVFKLFPRKSRHWEF